VGRDEQLEFLYKNVDHHFAAIVPKEKLLAGLNA
jgi:hypothetical protein